MLRTSSVRFSNARHVTRPAISEASEADARVTGKSEGVGTRTPDLRIKSPLLYQLSYALLSGRSFAGLLAVSVDAAGGEAL